jgi:3-phenylpropionate/trans-cinnamate dioxygenase ferredoxin reductase component
MTAPIVILGTGECGVRAAFALREAGYEGEILLLGEESSLPYERPPLSKKVPAAEKPIADEKAYGNANIELRRGACVGAIDPTAHRIALDDGGALTYSKLLLATGARPRSFDNIAEARTLRTSRDAAGIIGALEKGASMIVIGGGFIGLELASTARKLDGEVIVVEGANRPMIRAVPELIAERALSRHRELGVDVRTGTSVASATANRVELANGEVLEADIVVAGVGALPNTALAEQAGLAVADGIVVDERLQTSNPDIFAAGDCCCFPYRGRQVRLESWRAARDMGMHAAGSMLGGAGRYAKIPWFWSDQHDLTLQVAGLFNGAEPTLRRDLDDDAFILFQTDAQGVLFAASGIGTGNRVAKEIRLAEMMIERGIRLDPDQLRDPETNLKSLLRG